jgi:hypothetical protein
MEGDFRMNKRSFWGLRKEWKRHDVILCVGGFLYLLVGLYYIASRDTQTRSISLEILVQLAPMTFWGGCFIFAGLLAIISSRWPPFAETWGYVVFTSISAGWATAYMMGMLFGDAPSTNWLAAIVWGLFAFIWWAVSGLLNPDKTAVANGEARPA